MSTFTLICTLFLLFSVILNFIFAWYIRQLITKLTITTENIDFLLENTEEFEKHLSAVYEMEMFYGEPTLQSLIQHSRDIVEIMKDFEEAQTLGEYEEETEEEDE